jgi:GTP cyclohydrolase I
MTKVNSNIVTIVCLSALLSMVLYAFTSYKMRDRELMSKNIQEAISKGIDPLTVRCSYASENDNICVAFASIQQKQQEVINANKR